MNETLFIVFSCSLISKFFGLYKIQLRHGVLGEFSEEDKYSAAELDDSSDT